MYYKLSAKGLILQLALIALLSVAAWAEDNRGEDIVIGSQYKLQSEIMGEEQTILVYLPYGYEETQDSYPVMYLLNGDSRIRLAGAAAAIEDLDSKGKAPRMIVIGFGSNDNMRDYCPVRYQDREGTGLADRYLEYITRELIPWTEQTFRTNDYRILCGASNAGLLTVYTLFSQPSSFDAYIAASPAIGWFTEYMLEKAAGAFSNPETADHPIYMNYATDDLETIVTSAMPEFTEMFEQKAPEEMHWRMEVLDGVGHVPFISIHNGLLFLFPDWQYTKAMAIAGGLSGIREHFTKLSDRYGFEAKVDGSVLMDLGVHYIRGENWLQAIEVFEYYAGQYPGSTQAHFFLGESCRRQGDNERAIQCYRKALEINPTFTRAVSRLKELGAEL